jgi:hypothetical protein
MKERLYVNYWMSYNEAVNISPDSLKRSRGNKIFLQHKGKGAEECFS